MNDAARQPYWIVIQFKHGQVDRARRELGRQGFELFCPLVRRTGAEAKPVPMLKTYAFLQVTENAEPLRKITMTRGVQSVLGPSPTTPTRVPAAMVEAIRSRCDSDQVFQFGSARKDDVDAFLDETRDMGEEERGFLFLRHL